MGTFGKRLQAAREAAGLSQNALAMRIGLTRQAVSKLESPLHDSDPGWSTVQAIVQALGCSYGVLETGVKVTDYTPGPAGRPLGSKATSKKRGNK